MTSATQHHTIWLWLDGVFPRRISYYLLQKGLVSSPADLRAGVSTKSDLSIVPISLTPSFEGFKWHSSDPSNPCPQGVSNPCMRTLDIATGKSTLIHESTSIMLYLEELYPDLPLRSDSPLGRARMMDMIGVFNLVTNHTSYFLRNTVPELGMVQGLQPEFQTRGAALNAKDDEIKGMVKLQGWAQENGLQTTGWLTPGMAGPGLVDLVLAASVKFIKLVYGIDILGDKSLGPLAEWYSRFKGLSWWAELEERGDEVPDILTFGRESRAIWAKETGEYPPLL
jgi:glutathione S-transferase